MPIRLRGAALGLAAAACVAGPAAAAPSGATFTTDASGAAVNENHYASPDDVYLNGGPLCTGSRSALPNGWYAFRVTDPSGRTDVTAAEDVQERMFRVAGGTIAETSDPDHHPLSNARCGRKVLRVGPFDVPRPGVYKLWITPATPGRAVSWKACTAKTDNFTVDGPVPVLGPPPPPEDPPPPPPPTEEPPVPGDGGDVLALGGDDEGAVAPAPAARGGATTPSPQYGPDRAAPRPGPKVQALLRGVVMSAVNGTVTISVTGGNSHARRATQRARIVTLAIGDGTRVLRHGRRSAAARVGDRAVARWRTPLRAAASGTPVLTHLALTAPRGGRGR